MNLPKIETPLGGFVKTLKNKNLPGCFHENLSNRKPQCKFMYYPYKNKPLMGFFLGGVLQNYPKDF